MKIFSVDGLVFHGLIDTSSEETNGWSKVAMQKDGVLNEFRSNKKISCSTKR